MREFLEDVGVILHALLVFGAVSGIVFGVTVLVLAIASCIL